MSRYIRILNTIKSQIDSLTLTPSQSSCRARIEDRLVYPGIINLFGHHGVGKTLLGWTMASNGKTKYVVHPSILGNNFSSNNSFVFVDNVGSDRKEIRHISAFLETLKIDRAVLVTHYPANDYIFRTELELSNEDIDIILKNLEQLGFPIRKENWSNLWFLISQVAREQNGHRTTS